MSNSVYHINKGINRSIEFKGLKAQYIWWLGGVVIGLLVLFALLYFTGLHTYLCLGLITGTGVFSVRKIYVMSNRYGEYGLLKKMAKRNVPRCLCSRSRKWLFTVHFQK